MDQVNMVKQEDIFFTSDLLVSTDQNLQSIADNMLKENINNSSTSTDISGILHQQVRQEKSETDKHSHSDIKEEALKVSQGTNEFKCDNSVCDDPYIVLHNKGSFKCLLCNVEGINSKTLIPHLAGRRHKESLHLEGMSNKGSQRYRDSRKRKKKRKESKRQGGQDANYPRAYKEYIKAKSVLEANTVLIEDLPDSITKGEILDYFKTHGKPIKKNNFTPGDNQYAYIQFRDSNSVIELLGGDVTIKGIKLNIKSYKETVLPKCLDFSQLNEAIKLLPDFQTQLNKLIEEVQPKWLTNKYNVVCSDLQDILQKLFIYKKCKVFPFGAVNIGLGFTNVVDIHVELNKDEPGTSNNLKRNEEVNYIKQLKKKQLIHYLVFMYVPPDGKISNENRVECVHNATQLECHIYFTQWTSVLSSSLVRYYLSLDAKLKPLVIIIKYWGKIHQLIQPIFSSYCLTLLLIFYLQQTPYCLPPVEALERVKDPCSPDFVSKEEFTSEFLCNQSIPEILHGFFNYYANFDYTLYIISPYLGKPVLKTDFLLNKNLQYKKGIHDDFLARIYPKYRFNRRRIKLNIFLQNPFDHSNNMTRLVPDGLFNRFIKLCRMGADISKNLSVDNLALYKLFTACIPKPDYNYSSGCKFQITMGENLEFINSEINTKNILDPEEKVIHTKMIWYNLVKTFLISILTDLMKFDINIEEDKPEIKSQRLNEQLDVHDTNIVDSVTLHCSRSGIYNIKSAITERVVLNGIILNNQSELMQFICRKTFALNTYTLNLNMQTKINPTEVTIMLTHLNQEEQYFYGFAKLFAEYFPTWFQKYITELDDQSRKLKCSSDTKEEFNETKIVPDNNENFKVKPVELMGNDIECQRIVQIKNEPYNVQNNITQVVKSEPTQAEVLDYETEGQSFEKHVEIKLEQGNVEMVQTYDEKIEYEDVKYDLPEFIKVLSNETHCQNFEKDGQMKLELENCETQEFDIEYIDSAEVKSVPMDLLNNPTELKNVDQIKCESEHF